MNNAVIYLRVSSDKQTEESQLKPCREFCKERNYNVVNIFKDHAKSAYKNVKRPAFDEVNKLVKNRDINHIVVWALDRWTRRGAKELQNTIDYLSAYDVQLHSVQEKWLESINMPGGMGNVIRDFFVGLIGWMAQQESDLKSERIRASKKFQKAKDKGKVGRSKLPEKVVKLVIEKLEAGESYHKIHDSVIYKAKYGKIKNVSIGTISSINKDRLSKNVMKKSNNKNSQKSI